MAAKYLALSARSTFCCQFTLTLLATSFTAVSGQPRNCRATKSRTCCEFSNATVCCPEPLVPTSGTQCCVSGTAQCCDVANIQFRPFPRCCSAPDHCCPVPNTPQDPSLCCDMADGNNSQTCCELPLLPSRGCCMIPGFPPEIIDTDESQYQLVPQNYIKSMSKNETINSEFLKCDRKMIIRLTFGNPTLDPSAYLVPIDWSYFLSIPKTVRPKVLIESLLKNFWPEVIIPFLFPLMIIVMAVLSLIPFILIGGVGWAILFNLRFLAHKKIRMLIRAYLIRAEKFRRWKYEMAFPPQDLRKFRERDRYQMPKAFQDSDLSSDDEPAELAREQIPRQKTTRWTDEAIQLIGFDPDNIPMEWVYGDVLGTPEALRPEVKEFIEAGRRPSRDEEFDRESLNSGEWAEFLRNRITEKMQREKGMFLSSLHDKLKARRGSATSDVCSDRSEGRDGGESGIFSDG